MAPAVVERSGRGRTHLPLRPKTGAGAGFRVSGRVGHMGFQRVGMRAPSGGPGIGRILRSSRRRYVTQTRRQAVMKISAHGYASAMWTQTLRAVTRTRAPSFSSLTRIVLHCA